MFPIAHNHTCLAILVGVTRLVNSDKIMNSLLRMSYAMRRFP